MINKQHLGELEELVLLLIVMLGEEAYGLAIRRALQEQTNRDMTIGAIHGTVNRLEKKGYVESYLGGATDERGGRRKRIFTITAAGERSLRQSQELKLSLWQQIPALKLNLSV